MSVVISLSLTADEIELLDDLVRVQGAMSRSDWVRKKLYDTAWRAGRGISGGPMLAKERIQGNAPRPRKRVVSIRADLRPSMNVQAGTVPVAEASEPDGVPADTE